ENPVQHPDRIGGAVPEAERPYRRELARTLPPPPHMAGEPPLLVDDPNHLLGRLREPGATARSGDERPHHREGVVRPSRTPDTDDVQEQPLFRGRFERHRPPVRTGAAEEDEERDDAPTPDDASSIRRGTQRSTHRTAEA